jgi:hypothetical protein
MNTKSRKKKMKRDRHTLEMLGKRGAEKNLDSKLMEAT